MTAKHTPGPWTWHGDTTRNHDRIVTHESGEFGREQVALALDFNHFDRDAEADANARLIAAAPALLDAARAALESLVCIASEAGDVPEWNEGGHGYVATHQLRAAIAAATGEGVAS